MRIGQAGGKKKIARSSLHSRTCIDPRFQALSCGKKDVEKNQKMCQNAWKKSQKTCLPERMSEDLPNRMPERMSEIV